MAKDGKEKQLKHLYEVAKIIHKAGRISDKELAIRCSFSLWTFLKIRPYISTMFPTIAYDGITDTWFVLETQIKDKTIDLETLKTKHTD